MKALMVNMTLIISSPIVHATTYTRSRRLADALAATGARPRNETNPEQHAWI
jgi:hypothetical protein